MEIVNLGIIKSDNVWQSKLYESNAKNCRKNLESRIPHLSENKSFKEAKKEWTQISSHIDNEEREELCLCGMKIKTVYIFENVVNNNRVAIGSTCIDRFDKELVKKYKQSLKKPGYCVYCDLFHKNIEKHNKSNAHKLIYNKFVAKLNITITAKLKLYNDDEKARKVKIELEKVGRKCIEEYCNKYILNTEPTYKIRCVSCYLKKIKK